MPHTMGRLWRTEIAFPADLDGMDVPLRYTVEVSRRADGCEIDVELAGGAPEKTYEHPGNYHGRVIDWLTGPYVRLEGTDGSTGNLRLAEGTLVLCAPPVPNQYFYGCLHEKPEWPLRARFRVEAIPADALLVLGYEHYCCEVARHREGGPTEIGVDPATGAILDWRRGVGPGDVALRFTSPASPGLLARLPSTDPRHAAAAAYAANNHYFVEGEPCRLDVVVECGGAVALGELRLRYRVEDAFLRPLGEYVDCPLSPVPCGVPGAARLAGGAALGAGWDVGVYHLRAAAEWSGGTLEEYCAFEVMPASPAAPAAPRQSGLPVLFSMANEIRGLETDAFDPWRGVSDDAAHYTSMACFLPDFGRSRRVADVLHAYGRQWFAWVSSRTSDRLGWEAHRDVVAACDYLWAPQDSEPRTDVRYYLARPGRYTGVVLEALRRFVGETGAAVPVPCGEDLPRASFEALLATCWHEWLDYFSEYFHERILAPLWKELRQLNPGIRQAGYGPYQAYVAHYKGAHHLKHLGYADREATARAWDGFMALEDYPVASRYSISRGVYQLASCKMALPSVPIYPEMYSRGVQGCPDGAVNVAWPPAGTWDLPETVTRKRFYEYAFAVSWFDDGRFHYWKDDGFHSRTWSRQRYELLLKTWGQVRDLRPVRPLRTTAFVSSEACSRAHGSRLSGGEEPAVYNTTEEAPAWAYEMARADGQAAGFVTPLEAVAGLQAEDVDTLVLPPLYDATEDQCAAIRRLHEEGVSLLGFETVPGLEDLFGVAEAAAPRPAPHRIAVSADLETSPLAALAGLVERNGAAEEPMKYEAAGAQVLLQGEAQARAGAPVLFHHRTAWGNTALYNLPPTTVCRDEADERFRDGADSVSELMNRSVQMVLRELGAPAASASEGKLVAFRAENGSAVILIEEDAFPAEGQAIAPEIAIRLPGVRPEAIACEREYRVVSSADGEVVVRLNLAVHECAILTVAPAED